MKIAIWGTKKEAVYLYHQIKSNKENHVVCFVDNDKSVCNSLIDNKPVYSIDNLKKLYPVQVDTIILALRNGYSIACILKQLKSNDINKIGLLKPLVYDYNEEICLEGQNAHIIWLDVLRKPILPYLQVILIKTCNLNCKGCTHFANLFNKQIDNDNTYSIQKLKEDLRSISEKTKIFRLRLLGGEPLLYPELKEAVVYARKYFPDADIRVVTNGLLLMKASEDLFQCLKHYHIGFDISLYQPTMKIRQELENILQKKSVNYHFEGMENTGGGIKRFEKNIRTEGVNDPERAMSACHGKQCLTLLHGKLYKCPFEALSYKFYDFYHRDTDFRKDGYDIGKDAINWTDFLDKVYMQPVEACKYCSEKIEYFDWSTTYYPEYTDWTVQ